jgi:hypothetical protein
MNKILFITILLATAYSWDAEDDHLHVDEDGMQLLPAPEHACIHDTLDVDPLREWKSKYVPNPFVTMEDHIQSYKDQALKSTYMSAPWQGLRVQFDYTSLEQ